MRAKLTKEEKEKVFKLYYSGVPYAMAVAMVKGIFKGPYES